MAKETNVQVNKNKSKGEKIGAGWEGEKGISLQFDENPQYGRAFLFPNRYKGTAPEKAEDREHWKKLPDYVVYEFPSKLE